MVAEPVPAPPLPLRRKVIMVAVGLLIAWLSLRDDSGGATGAAGPLGRPGASGRGQLAGAAAQPYPSAPAGMAPGGSGGGRGDEGGITRRRQQEGSSGGSGAGNKALSLRREDSASGKLGSFADTPPRRRKVQGNARSGGAGMVAVSGSGSFDGSRQGSGSSMALVPADDLSGALARSECTRVVEVVPSASTHGLLGLLQQFQQCPVPCSCVCLAMRAMKVPSLQVALSSVPSRLAAASATPAWTWGAGGCAVTSTDHTFCRPTVGAAGNMCGVLQARALVLPTWHMAPGPVPPLHVA